MYINKPKLLSHVNWKKTGRTLLITFLLLIFAGILFLFLGLLYVGHPSPPATETPANALIALGFFLICSLVIYGFAGRWRNK